MLRAMIDLDLTAEALEKARDALRQYRALVKKVLGETPEEVHETLQALEGLTPAQIWEALRLYRSRDELPGTAVQPEEW